MKFWCLLLALGLIQVATFVDNVQAKGKDSDGDGIDDEGRVYSTFMQLQ